MSNYQHDKYFDEELVDLVYSIALRYRNNFVELEDLLQEGFLGLAKAYKNFDPSKNILFKTYAYYWIRKQILEYIKNIKKFSYISFDEIETEKLSYQEKFEDNDNHNEISFNEEVFTELEQKVLDLSFNKKVPLSDIAKELNLKRERVRQVQNKALRKIKINKELTESLLKVNFQNV
ncbi:MAG: sigma-70 family RNA polymerase sigma factor [Elusimicrobiota bacterium]|nr:sigma-70 family RNA polymerase sigma factor [Elusimicrobiota bacterium]